MKIMLAIIFSIVFTSAMISTYAQEEIVIPSWIKVIATAWGNDQITDLEFKSAMEFMIETGIIHLDNPFKMSEEQKSAELTSASNYADELNTRIAELEKINRELEIQLENYPDNETEEWYESEMEILRQMYQDEYKAKSDLEEKYDVIKNKIKSLENEIDYLNEQLEKSQS